MRAASFMNIVRGADGSEQGAASSCAQRDSRVRGRALPTRAPNAASIKNSVNKIILK